MLQNDHPYIYLLNLTDSSLIFWYADKMSLLFVSVPPAAASLTPSTLFLLIHWMDWKPESWACLIYVQMKNPQALGEELTGVSCAEIKNANIRLWHLFTNLFLWRWRVERALWKIPWNNVNLALLWWFSLFTGSWFYPRKRNYWGIGEFSGRWEILYLVFTTLCVFERNDIVIQQVIYLKTLQHKKCDVERVGVSFILHPRGSSLTFQVP